jgi:mannose-6-phosphate isomerase-like protein (cupin superfamily)
MFYVLDGTLTVQVEDELLEAPPGSFLCVPPGTRHTFANRCDDPVRFLNFNTPGGFEEYMRELAAAWRAAVRRLPSRSARSRRAMTSSLPARR